MFGQSRSRDFFSRIDEKHDVLVERQGFRRFGSDMVSSFMFTQS